jgi:transcriptional regulator with XRE-family HTH domain
MKNAAKSRNRSPIGGRIYAARQAAGISQEKLGVMVGLEEGSAGTRISRYECGIHEPNVSTSIAIAKALNVPLAYLYCEREDLAQILLVIAKLNPAELLKIYKTLKINA